jgi:hypothetical protein
MIANLPSRERAVAPLVRFVEAVRCWTDRDVIVALDLGSPTRIEN